jgi:hypothetical protein
MRIYKINFINYLYYCVSGINQIKTNGQIINVSFKGYSFTFL